MHKVRPRSVAVSLLIREFVLLQHDRQFPLRLLPVGTSCHRFRLSRFACFCALESRQTANDSGSAALQILPGTLTVVVGNGTLVDGVLVLSSVNAGQALQFQVNGPYDR